MGQVLMGKKAVLLGLVAGLTRVSVAWTVFHTYYFAVHHV